MTDEDDLAAQAQGGEPGHPVFEGWGFPRDSRKAHYFRDTMSLCRKFGFYRGPLEPEGVWDGGVPKPSPDDCAPCRKALNRERSAG